MIDPFDIQPITFVPVNDQPSRKALYKSLLS